MGDTLDYEIVQPAPPPPPPPKAPFVPAQVGDVTRPGRKLGPFPPKPPPLPGPPAPDYEIVMSADEMRRPAPQPQVPFWMRATQGFEVRPPTLDDPASWAMGASALSRGLGQLAGMVPPGYNVPTRALSGLGQATLGAAAGLADPKMQAALAGTMIPTPWTQIPAATYLAGTMGKGIWDSAKSLYENYTGPGQFDIQKGVNDVINASLLAIGVKEVGGGLVGKITDITKNTRGQTPSGTIGPNPEIARFKQPWWAKVQEVLGNAAGAPTGMDTIRWKEAAERRMNEQQLAERQVARAKVAEAAPVAPVVPQPIPAPVMAPEGGVVLPDPNAPIGSVQVPPLPTPAPPPVIPEPVAAAPAPVAPPTPPLVAPQPVVPSLPVHPAPPQQPPPAQEVQAVPPVVPPTKPVDLTTPPVVSRVGPEVKNVINLGRNAEPEPGKLLIAMRNPKTGDIITSDLDMHATLKVKGGKGFTEPGYMDDKGQFITRAKAAVKNLQGGPPKSIEEAMQAVVRESTSEEAKAYAKSYLDTGDKNTVLYVLSNLSGWKGPRAKVVKQYLKDYNAGKVTEPVPVERTPSDKESQGGTPGSIIPRQEPGGTIPDQGAGSQTPPPSGVLQAPHQGAEVVPPVPAPVAANLRAGTLEPRPITGDIKDFQHDLNNLGFLVKGNKEQGILTPKQAVKMTSAADKIYEKVNDGSYTVEEGQKKVQQIVEDIGNIRENPMMAPPEGPQGQDLTPEQQASVKRRGDMARRFNQAVMDLRGRGYRPADITTEANGYVVSFSDNQGKWITGPGRRTNKGEAVHLDTNQLYIPGNLTEATIIADNLPSLHNILRAVSGKMAEEVLGKKLSTAVEMPDANKETSAFLEKISSEKYYKTYDQRQKATELKYELDKWKERREVLKKGMDQSTTLQAKQNLQDSYDHYSKMIEKYEKQLANLEGKKESLAPPEVPGGPDMVLDHGKIVPLRLFEWRKYSVEDPKQGNYVLDLPRFVQDVLSEKIQSKPAQRALLSSLHKLDLNHPLRGIRLEDELPQDLGYRGRYTQPFQSAEGQIFISTKTVDGTPVPESNFVRTLNHELIHNVVTSKFDSAPLALRDRARKLYNFAKDKAQGTKFEEHNAFKNMDEFYAEALSNRRIREWLTTLDYAREVPKVDIGREQYPDIATPSHLRSMYGGFLDIIKNLLKLPDYLRDPVTGLEVNAITALDEAVHLSKQFERVRRKNIQPLYSVDVKNRGTSFAPPQPGGVPPVIPPTPPGAAAAPPPPPPRQGHNVTPTPQGGGGTPNPITTPASAGQVALGLINQTLGQKAKGVYNKWRGYSAPRHAAANPDVADKLVRYASAKIAAPEVAKSLATDVLGKYYKDPVFNRQLGAVLVEDRLRAVKKAFEELAAKSTDPVEQAELLDKAQSVTTTVRQPYSILKNEAEYQRLLADPEIKDALDRHKQLVQPVAQEMHQKLNAEYDRLMKQAEKEKDPVKKAALISKADPIGLARPGEQTGAFVNLKAILSPDDVESARSMIFGSQHGNLANPRLRPSVFGKETKGTGWMYDQSYRTIAERMIRGNYEQSALKDYYDSLVEHKLGAEERTGAPGPVGPDGVKYKKVEIKPGKAFMAGKNMWVRPDLEPEMRRALDVDQVAKMGIGPLTDLATHVQVTGPTDLAWHMVNMMAVLGGSQGAKSAFRDIARKSTPLGFVDGFARMAYHGLKSMTDSPEYQKIIADYSKIGAGRAKPIHQGGVLSSVAKVFGVPKNIAESKALKYPDPTHWLGLLSSKLLKHLDTGGRVAASKMYDNLVERKMVADTETGRREFINRLGQYNSRLMPQWQSILRENSLSSFVVAGKNMNRQAVRRILTSPGFKALNPEAAAKARLVEMTSLASLLWAVPTAMNLALTGTLYGRNNGAGIPAGAVDLGEDDEQGRPKYFDPSQTMLARRGLRILGIDALRRAAQEHFGVAKTVKEVLHDVFAGLIHPWAGPSVRTASIAATGKDFPSGYLESKNPTDWSENVMAAIRNSNPTLAAYFKSKEEGTPQAQGQAKQLQGALGFKTGRAPTHMQKLEAEVQKQGAPSIEEAGLMVRRKAEQAVEKGALPKSQLATRAGAERNLWDTFMRQDKITAALPTPQQDWLKQHNLTVPGYEAEVTLRGVRLAATESEAEVMQKAVAEQYSKAIDVVMKLPGEPTQKRLDKVLDHFRARARVSLRKEMNKSVLRKNQPQEVEPAEP